MSYENMAFCSCRYVERVKGKITIVTPYYQRFTQKMHFVEHFTAPLKNYLKNDNYYSDSGVMHPWRAGEGERRSGLRGVPWVHHERQAAGGG